MCASSGSVLGPSSPSAASHWFWCMVSGRSERASISLPRSLVRLYRWVASSRSLDPAVRLAVIGRGVAAGIDMLDVEGTAVGIVGHGGKARRQKVPHVDATQHRARDRAGHSRFLKGTGAPSRLSAMAVARSSALTYKFTKFFIRIPASSQWRSTRGKRRAQKSAVGSGLKHG